jgi:PAS domain S-box-containing protein
MNYSLKNIFRNRKKTFSNFWFGIVEARFVLCIIILLFSVFTHNAIDLKYIISSTVIYFSLNVSFGFWDSSKLQLKRVRIIPALVDVLFLTFIIYLTGGQDSPWFLLYLFPIISVSRYLSYEGTIPLTVLTIIAYMSVVQVFSQSVDYSSLILRCLVFLSIALVAGNLTRAGRRKENRVLEIFKEIDNAILNNAETNKVLRLILNKAVEFTNSDMGQMKILSTESNSNYTISIESESQKLEWNIDSLFERYCEKAINSKKSFSILTIREEKEKNKESPHEIQDIGERLIYVFRAYTEGSENIAGSALFVPLILNKKVSAILAMFSKNRFHYSESEAIKLESFAQLLGIALRIYQEITDSETEKKERLKMLYEIGEQLKVEQGLKNIFDKVVELAYNRLNSEEAALFIWDDENKEITKEAVKGPSEEITLRLKHIEKPYKKGDSLVGKIFQNKKRKYLRLVGDILQDQDDKKLSITSSNVKYYDDYSKTLPSGRVYHYIGVPLIIGEEVLGVLRVINKRGPTYSVENNKFALSQEGFEEEDVELMQTIASQVASAIRSAMFIAVQRSYQELIESSPDPIIVLDRKGKVKIFNEACEKIWGFSADEVLGRHVTNYYESETHSRDIGGLLDKSPNNRIQDYPAKIKSRSGEIIPISLSASLLFDNQGSKIGSIGVFKDLRETLKLQEEKTSAEKLATLGKLAHTVGHEIKHDIATALNYIDTLAYECTDDEELSEIYRDIQEALNEAVDKFQNMLLVGKPKPPEKRLVSADDVFHRIEESLRRRANAKNIEFLINYPDEESELEADVEQFRQVLSNLFDNSVDAIAARKFTSEKGRIELIAQASNGDLHITWQDNGCGIPPQIIPKIFTPFVTNKPTGNGLGLFNVKNIIENHGGGISVESEEGARTSFRIVLPLYKKNTSFE